MDVREPEGELHVLWPEHDSAFKSITFAMFTFNGARQHVLYLESNECVSERECLSKLVLTTMVEDGA